MHCSRDVIECAFISPHVVSSPKCSVLLSCPRSFPVWRAACVSVATCSLHWISRECPCFHHPPDIHSPAGGGRSHWVLSPTTAAATACISSASPRPPTSLGGSSWSRCSCSAQYSSKSYRLSVSGPLPSVIR